MKPNAHIDLHTLYSTRSSAFSAKENHFKKKANRYAALRLFFGISIIVALWMAITYLAISWLAVALVSTVVYIALVFAHAKVNKQQVKFRRLKMINEVEKSALSGDYTSLPSGSPYIDHNHPFTFDIDIFGDQSLFQYVNRTCTSSGERLLANNLKHKLVAIEKIIERQKTISALTPLLDFRQQFMVIGADNPEKPEDLSQLMAWLASPKSTLNRPLIRFLSFLLSGITFVLLILALAELVPYVSLVLSVLINLAFIQLFNHTINKTHAVISRKYNLLRKYAYLLELLNAQTFTDPFLTSLLEKSDQAHVGIKRLSILMSFFDQRLNDLVAVVLNGFFLSDIHCIVGLDKWKNKHRESMPSWLDSIFIVDELNSFANFAFNNPSYCFPQFTSSTFIETKGLGHPLMRKNACVLNDFIPSDKEKVVVLTGANMSGKSTFLRAIGINTVLANCGAPVYATSFAFNNAEVYTSMRVMDSLEQNTSYFYAELERLSLIMNKLRSGQKMIILLDEILKGTNSADKLAGSIGLIEEFLRHDCLCIIATHDLDLGKLEIKYPLEVSNYCFESRLEANELYFDYKINKGIAKNKNATHLMQKAGLIK